MTNSKRGTLGSNTVVVRPARPSDTLPLLAAIRALAEYEEEPQAVENDEVALQASLFGPNPAVFAHVAEDVDGAIIGIAIWFVTYSTWTGRHGIWLEDLFVDPASRRMGVGRALVAALADVAIERRYARLEWTVLDWNELALGFYRSIGAQAMGGWTTHRLDAAALATLAQTTE